MSIALRWSGLASRLTVRNITLTLLVSVVGILVVVPLFYLLWNSFKPIAVGNLSDFSLGNFTLDNFREAFRNPKVLLLLPTSLYFAFGSITISFAFGTAIAFLVERTNCPWRDFIYTLMFVPMMLPGMLKAVAWIFLLSPTIGILNSLWPFSTFAPPLLNAYSIPAMFWVEGLSQTPTTFLLLGTAFRKMDPSLEEAAYASGASKPATFFRVTMPLMMPAIAGVLLLNFVRAIEEFEVPLVMGAGKGIYVFSTAIYYAIRDVDVPRYGEGFVLSLVIVFIALIALLLYQRVIGQSESYATVTGKGFRPRLIDLGKWRGMCLGFVLFYATCAIVLPFLLLLYASFLPYYRIPSSEFFSLFTLSNYTAILGDHYFFLALKNTGMVLAVVVPAVMLLSVTISWIVIRMRPRGYQILDALVFIPRTLPGIATGFSLLVLFLAFPNPIYGTVWIITVAYIINFLPLGTRYTHAGVAQVKAELAEAASTSGAGLLTTFRRIVIPLILPNMVAGAIFIALLVAKVLGTAAILSGPDNYLLSVYLWNLLVEGMTPGVGALGVLMILGLGILVFTARRLGQRGGIHTQV
ncbi:ABC transporter permease [Chloroflexota bacterium]